MSSRAGPPPSSAAGIVVGRQDYGDADRVLRVLTAEHGRVALFATAARRARSPFAVLDVGVRAQLAWRAGRGDLGRLARAELLDGRLGLRGDVERIVQAAWLCEVAGALATPEHAEPRLYGLLETALLLLDAASGPVGEAFLAGFEAKALTFAGVAPGLERCAVCGRPVGEESGEPVGLVAAAGGVLHLACREPGAAWTALEPGYVAALADARRRPLRELLDEPLPEGPPRLLAELVEAHVGHALHARTALAALTGAGRL